MLVWNSVAQVLWGGTNKINISILPFSSIHVCFALWSIRWHVALVHFIFHRSVVKPLPSCEIRLVYCVVSCHILQSEALKNNFCKKKDRLSFFRTAFLFLCGRFRCVLPNLAYWEPVTHNSTGRQQCQLLVGLH